MERVERVWHRRLRWRLRGAWLWPAFVVLTLRRRVLLALLPPYAGAPENVFPGVLLAGFVNLLAVAVVAPLAGPAAAPPPARPAAPDRLDYAGTALLAAITALLSPAGCCTARPSRPRRRASRRSPAACTTTWSRRRREYRGCSTPIDAMRLERDYYRACVPGATRGAGCACSSTPTSARRASRATPRRSPTARPTGRTAGSTAEVAPLDDHDAAVDAGLAAIEREPDRRRGGFRRRACRGSFALPRPPFLRRALTTRQLPVVALVVGAPGALDVRDPSRRCSPEL